MREASFAFYFFILAGLHEYVSSHNETVKIVTVSDITLTPLTTLPMPFKRGESSFITVNYSFTQRNVTVYPTKGFIVTVFIDNENVASVVGQEKYYIDYKNPTGNITVQVNGANAGRSRLRFHIHDWLINPVKHDIPVKHGRMFADKLSVPEQEFYTDLYFDMYVTMHSRPIDTLFNTVVFLLVVTANIGMGTQVDLEIVKSQLRRPFAVGIGLFSQFVFMPVIAFVVAVGLEMEPGIALGLFACGCAPGGLASNIFTYLLHGNVSLSITMTLVSTLASLGLLPLWLFTLGTYLYSNSDIKIPFLNIVLSLFVIIIPTVIGLILQKKAPRLAALIIKSTKFIMAIFVVFMFTVGTYANLWVLNLVNSSVIIASAALPYLGFVLGGLAAIIGRQSYSDIVTIAVETGIQNTAVPIVLLRMSLTGPEQATSIVVPLISSTLTPIPFIVVIIYMEIKESIQNKCMSRVEQATSADAVNQEEETNFENTRAIVNLSGNTLNYSVDKNNS